VSTDCLGTHARDHHPASLNVPTRTALGLLNVVRLASATHTQTVRLIIGRTLRGSTLRLLKPKGKERGEEQKKQRADQVGGRQGRKEGEDENVCE
jgi:hypothetical protein